VPDVDLLDSRRLTGPSLLLDRPGAIVDFAGPDEEARSVARALDLAEQDDLVLIFGDEVERSWKQITSYQSAIEPTEADAREERSPPPALDPNPTLPGDLDLGEAEIISDERGVRLAREAED